MSPLAILQLHLLFPGQVCVLPHDVTACVNSANISYLHSDFAATLAVRECLHDVMNGMSHRGCMMQHDSSDARMQPEVQEWVH